MSTPSTLTRRQALQALAGLGMTTTLFGLAGCESAVSQAESGGDGQPKPGGRIKAGISDDVIPGNFFTNSNHGITTIIGLTYDSLVRVPNDRVEPTPRLATAWDLAEDGRSLTLELRDDVKFHSGRAFTSADVEFSIKTYADTKWNGQMRSTAAAVSGFDTSDPHRVILKFDHPLSNIFDLLDTAPIVDSETLDQLGTGSEFVGTGPFKFTGWTPNSSITFDRNPDYWVPERPYVDGVDVRIVSDRKALLSSLKSGQVDFADGISYLDTETLLKSNGFAAVTLEGAEDQIYVGAVVTAKPLDDLRVRQAIAYALDRERIVSEVLRGSGYAINLPWPKHSPAFDEAKNRTYALDVAKAKALVAEVGKIDPIPLTYGSANPVMAATAAIVQSNLDAVGIPVELDPVDSAQFVKQLIGAQFRGLWVNFHSWAQHTPSTLTVSAYPFNARKNASHYDSDAYIEDAEAAWTTPDGASAAAKEAYAKVSDDLLESLFLIEIAVVQMQFVHSALVQGISYTKRHEVQFTDTWLG